MPNDQYRNRDLEVTDEEADVFMNHAKQRDAQAAVPNAAPQARNGLNNEFREGCDDLDEAIHRLRCFFHIAQDISLNNFGNSKEANHLIALLDVCGEKVEEAASAKERVWKSQGGK